MIFVCLAAIVLSYSQEVVPPAFEVASIKVNDPARNPGVAAGFSHPSPDTYVYVGTLATFTGQVSMSDNALQLFIVDGQSGYYLTLADTAQTLNTVNASQWLGSQIVTFQDGYFILNRKGTNQFFLSDLYDIVFPALNIETKSGNSDPIVAVISVSRQLYLLGTNTTEIWYDAGQSGSSPFARQDGRFSQVGCAAANSLSVLAEQFFWLGSNAQGTGVVYTLEGSLPKRISTHAVEFSIQNAVGNISQSTAFSYQSEGHYFYCLNVPGIGSF